MSEQDNIRAFTPVDIHPNASENDVLGPQTPIMALADEVKVVDPRIFGSETGHFDNDHYIREQEFAQERHQWLVDADAAFREKQYNGCIDLLRRAYTDLDHAGYYYDDAHKQTLLDIIDDCVQLIIRDRALGRPAVITSLAS